MTHFYFLLALGLSVLLALAWQIWRLIAHWFYPPYRADQTLFTPAQRRLKIVLEQAVGYNYRVYGRIRIADIIHLRGHLTPREQMRAWARLEGLSVDFLLCTPETSALVGAVLLLPCSRWTRLILRLDQIQRICAAAQLPLLCIEERDVYSEHDITQQLFTVLNAHWLGVIPNDDMCYSVADIDAEQSDIQPVNERRDPVLSISEVLELAPRFQINTMLDIEEKLPRIIKKSDAWRV